ncbi:hypothetical protein BKA82DRAFT_295315 [Pisolithus tinctorius]|uniref:Uncharacterized protein n=1 Tax=Pisolithus tinctorius Marx 270 TaxID=870435 RepID=A0A0C3JE29_PISTI|nr:hypothetical protein BKA82DRAFT_295315 [Pisolithus tinctorius]KIN95871.1 hypothetical protein M404DRAFT_295315 [Pisolithus tinctorius Marx 270]
MPMFPCKTRFSNRDDTFVIVRRCLGKKGFSSTSLRSVGVHVYITRYLSRQAHCSSAMLTARYRALPHVDAFFQGLSSPRSSCGPSTVSQRYRWMRSTSSNCVGITRSMLRVTLRPIVCDIYGG